MPPPPPPPLSGANAQAMPVHQHPQGQYVSNQPMPAQQQGVYVGNAPMQMQQHRLAQYAGNQGGQAEETMHVGVGSLNPNIGYTGGNLYKPPDVVHLVFTTESTDKQSQRRRYMEVNATMPAVQQFMYGSEQPHDWSRKEAVGREKAVAGPA